jgi:hypothetical protein
MPMKFISIILISIAAFFIQSDSPVTADCMCNGIPLHGKVQFVDSFADFKVQIVANFEDLRVDTVNTFPDHCGQWQIVNSFPDFTVELVESFPDFKIKYVNSFPGID